MTGSTTVDSNFLLAHKEQLDEVFQVYLMISIRLSFNLKY